MGMVLAVMTAVIVAGLTGASRAVVKALLPKLRQTMQQGAASLLSRCATSKKHENQLIAVMHNGTEKDRCLLMTSFYCDDSDDFRVPMNFDNFKEAENWLDKQFIRAVGEKYFSRLRPAEHKLSCWAAQELNRAYRKGDLTVEKVEEIPLARPVGQHGIYTDSGRFGSTFDWKCDKDCQYCKR